jgi:hypothetical protein
MLTDQDYPDPHSVTYKALPKIGYIALLSNQPIAAGFLRKVEGNVVAQIDCLVSNPYYGSIIRHQAISGVVDRLITDAKEMKLKGILAFTKDGSVLKRASELNFQVVNQIIMALSFD